jgi:hypothetical protein
MPYLSDGELQHSIERLGGGREIDRKDEGEVNFAALGPMAGSMGAAGVVGFVRAKLENPSTGQWNVPGTDWDAEAVLFLVSAAVALGGSFVGVDSQYRSYAAIGAIGIGSHYLGEIGRRYGKTGKLDWHVGAGVPPWDPTSYDPTQFSAPHDDAQAHGLASSGV